LANSISGKRQTSPKIKDLRPGIDGLFAKGKVIADFVGVVDRFWKKGD
jgi:hypothetical protein